jgi:tetratricopeptide (TPR) repeat protein
MANATEKKESKKLSDRLVVFIQKNRVLLLAVIGTLIVAFFAFGVVVAIRDASNEKAIASIEELSQQYDSIRVETDESKKSVASTALLGNLETFAKSHSGFSAARAHSVIAGIRADRKEWSEAVSAWLAAADALPNSYLAPVSVYNAATAAEELGDGTRALELYARCADKYASSFSQAPRAYLAIGRLNEERKDFDAATAAYKKIVETWPNDSWSKLAHGRLLAIASLNVK